MKGCQENCTFFLGLSTPLCLLSVILTFGTCFVSWWEPLLLDWVGYCRYQPWDILRVQRKILEKYYGLEVYQTSGPKVGFLASLGPACCVTHVCVMQSFFFLRTSQSTADYKQQESDNFLKTLAQYLRRHNIILLNWILQTIKWEIYHLKGNQTLMKLFLNFNEHIAKNANK